MLNFVSMIVFYRQGCRGWVWIFLWGNAKDTLGILNSMPTHAEVFEFGYLGLEVDYVLGYEYGLPTYVVVSVWL